MPESVGDSISLCIPVVSLESALTPIPRRIISMDTNLPRRFIMGLLVLVIAGVLLFVLVAKPPWATRSSVSDNMATDDPTPRLSSPTPGIVTATDTPAVADPTPTASPLSPTPASAGATATPLALSKETTATPVPPSPVTITMTEEELTALVEEGLESAEGDAGDATGGLPIYDPVITITDEQIELDAVTPTLLGEMDLYLATVPVAENGELHFQVTAATVSGISLPGNVISQIKGELDQILSQWLSGGSEIQGVTLSDGQISVVVLP